MRVVLESGVEVGRFCADVWVVAVVLAESQMVQC